ncbi:MAG TPA: squalene--hopene cyclase [Solirubrobacteraceae bacterium]|nr:squalene--hopene cyclase [Solirubrobacteraceae bacterium]
MSLGEASRAHSVPGAEAAIERASCWLLDRQAPGGWWKGELQTNVTMDAEDLLLREFLGIRDERLTAATANWIRSQQRADGTWANFHAGPADLSTCVESYVALKLAGDDVQAQHMRAAREAILGMGGVECARVFTHIWLALFGQWPWRGVPALPPEVVLLPPSVPLNVYDFACWARQTVVALTIVSATRPQRPLPFGIEEIRTGNAPAPYTGWGAWLDRALHAYERMPVRPLRRHALREAERWIVQRQEADGSWGGIQPPWVYSLIALHLRGYAIDHPVMRAGLEGLDRFAIEEDGMRRLEACQSPIWDTALAMIALADAGMPRDDPALLAAADWLLEEQVTEVRGDWAVRTPKLQAGGWAFEFENDFYPDVDDTAEVVLALRRVAHPFPERVDAAVELGVEWLLGMRSSDGAWAAFDVDNTRAAVRDLPFCDFGEVIDPPSADVTAHALEMLAHEGRADRRAIDWLLAEQEDGGSWFGRWGVNHVYGTGGVVPALVAAGVPQDHPAIVRALEWLRAHQNADGGWGEDCRSYREADWIGRGESTASQTAWALLAFIAAGDLGEAPARGVRWLVETQNAEGTWDEPWFTGTGFPGDFLINYHLYRHVFPLSALGRWRDATGGEPAG